MQNTTRTDDATLPEVVPVESTNKDNTIYHHYSWFERPIPTSDNGSDAPITSITNPYSHAIEESTIGVKGFHKTWRKNFALLVALGIFLFTALALSTGLGIPLAKCRNRVSPDGYAALGPLKVNLVKMDAFCNKNGKLTRNSTYEVNESFHFDLYCGVKFNPGLPAYDAIARNGVANGTIQNILSIVSYSVSDCINACASMNKVAKAGDSTNPPCQSITFLAGMGAAVTQHDGNCFLKAATVNNLNDGVSDNNAISAEVGRLRKED